MSPEQLDPTLLKGQELDGRSDLYSLGMVFYEMLTGQRAAGAWEAPSRLRGELPPAFDRIVRKLLAAQRESRYGTVRAVARDLREALRLPPEGAERGGFRETAVQHGDAEEKARGPARDERPLEAPGFLLFLSFLCPPLALLLGITLLLLKRHPANRQFAYYLTGFGIGASLYLIPSLHYAWGYSYSDEMNRPIAIGLILMLYGMLSAPWRSEAMDAFKREQRDGQDTSPG